MSIFRAELETVNFSFEAYGNTAGMAVAHLKRGMRLHATTYRIPADQLIADHADAITVYPIKVGGVYRDREEIT